MAGIDTQKQLLSLIRDFTSERSRGEQRVVGLKKRIDSLQSEVEAANEELEHAKRVKESAEEDLNGYIVESSLNDSTIQSLEARIALLQGEISTVGNEVEALKVLFSNCAYSFFLCRDQFISQMAELNNEMRLFSDLRAVIFVLLQHIYKVSDVKDNKDRYKAESKAIKDMVNDLNSQLAKEEEGYVAEQNLQKQLHKELDEYEKKMSLMEAITDKTNSIQALARYPLFH
ncbi:unnamed protein product [Cochlearia groenlandica]